MKEITRKLRKALRGRVGAGALVREALRRTSVRASQQRERRLISLIKKQDDGKQCVPELTRAWRDRSAAELLAHFRTRRAPRFPTGLCVAQDDESDTDNASDKRDAKMRELLRTAYAEDCQELTERAEKIVCEHEWRVFGYGEIKFGDAIDWSRDPVSGARWSHEFHADIELVRADGSDIRTLWEVNRLGHLLTLAQSFFLTGDERYTRELFAQLESWRAQNPAGLGANWACSMEVALRAINLLAAFALVRDSHELTEARLLDLLLLFGEHGKHIRRNLEFSYIATSNHYLSNIVGLLWLGVLVPELADAAAWREFATRELGREIDKQILDDGADDESSTGYHRFVLELLFYSLILCDRNDIKLDNKTNDARREKIKKMFSYTRAVLRPDGRAALIGDTDSGQVLPFAVRHADEQRFLLDAGAAYFADARLKLLTRRADDTHGANNSNANNTDVASDANDEMPSVETLWLLGAAGVAAWKNLIATESESQVFPDAGAIVMRDERRGSYLHFNLSGAGLNGRGSHAHNDKLSVEVAACGQLFISDPGSYVYSADLDARHLFRSTAYHSTVEVDSAEQNTIERALPFVIGDEARPRLVSWQTNERYDLSVAEHVGYMRLAAPVAHRRAVYFDKTRGFWIIEDLLQGAASPHTYKFRFHFAPELRVEAIDSHTIVASTIGSGSPRSDNANDKANDEGQTRGARLFVIAIDATHNAAMSGGQTLGFKSGDIELESKFVSRDYGAREPSVAACWSVRGNTPAVARWLLLPVCASEDERERLQIVEEVRLFDLAKLSEI